MPEIIEHKKGAVKQEELDKRSRLERNLKPNGNNDGMMVYINHITVSDAESACTLGRQYVSLGTDKYFYYHAQTTYVFQRAKNI